MNYHNITKDDMRNGDGLRVVLWLAGCDHHCKGCQNPITWNPYDGLVYDYDAEAELLEELAKSYISGITLSGGDPLHPQNRDDVLSLVTYIRKNFPSKDIWIYTGYLWEDIVADEEMRQIAELTDVIVDGEFKEDLLDATYPWAGSTNQRVIDSKKSLWKGEVVLHESN